MQSYLIYTGTIPIKYYSKINHISWNEIINRLAQPDLHQYLITGEIEA
jgi:hypothetical protein